MKHLTQSEYQSLPAQEQCDWKEQWMYKERGTGKWFSCVLVHGYYENEGCETKIIYIPITPNLAETLFNAEMGDGEEFINIEYHAVKYADKYLQNFGHNIPHYAKTGFIAGHNHATKTIIDIVEAETERVIKLNLSTESQFYKGKLELLDYLLTKLKEIT